MLTDFCRQVGRQAGSSKGASVASGRGVVLIRTSNERLSHIGYIYTGRLELEHTAMLAST